MERVSVSINQTNIDVSCYLSTDDLDEISRPVLRGFLCLVFCDVIN